MNRGLPNDGTGDLQCRPCKLMLVRRRIRAAGGLGSDGKERGVGQLGVDFSVDGRRLTFERRMSFERRLIFERRLAVERRMTVERRLAVE